MTHSTPLVSVVLSLRNEENNIPTLVSRLDRMFSGESVDYELIFVNDASTDNSFALLLRERESNPRVKILNMSRRFGVAECVRAGMAVSRGAAVIYMDADLQDPPEIIPTLLEHWRQGAQVVHTVRTYRHGENRIKMWLTRRAYAVVQFGATISLPVNAGDFKLLSRMAVDHLLQLRESDPYMRGLVVWVGFRQVLVEYERQARHAGKTHFPLLSRNPWKTLLLGMTSFSFTPIYVCCLAAAGGLLVALLVAGLSGGLWIAGSPLAPRTSFLALLIFFWATTNVAVGVVGLYVVRIYKDVRGRPPYIVESTVGLTTGGEDASR
jgi:dolichol-phosphate mannosyltransferase